MADVGIESTYDNSSLWEKPQETRSEKKRSDSLPGNVSSLSKKNSISNLVKAGSSRRISLSSSISSLKLKDKKVFSKQQLVELSILSSNVQNNSNKKTISIKFGVPLAEIDQGREIPLFVLKCTSFLETHALRTEAIFFYENADHIASLSAMLEKGQTELTAIQDHRSIAALLKYFFQKLPEPLMTFELYDNFLYANTIEQEQFIIHALRSLVYRLPRQNRVLLQYLLSFLNSVVANAEFNLMSASKLAKAWGPVLLKPKVIPSDIAIHQTITCPHVVEKLMTHYERIFLIIEDKDAKYNLKESVPLVRTATIESLMERLLDDFNPESEFKEIFFFTHLYFTDSADLLQKMLQMYENFLKANSLWADKAGSQVVKLIKHWFKTYTSEMYGKVSTLRHVVNEFAQKLRDTENLKSVSKLLGNIEANTCHPDSMNKKSAFDIPSFQILDFSVSDVAKQMALLDQATFINLDTRECILKRFTKPEESPTFTALTNRFNEYTCWVATEILKRDKIDQRAAVLKHFIKLAEACREVKNFNACYSIIAALNLASIARLKQTWGKLSKNTLAKYSKLMELFSITKNFKNYRDELAKAQKPVIPYFALFPKYLNGLEETQPNTVEGWPNFAKMRALYAVSKDITQYKTPCYDFVKVAKLQEYLTKLPSLDENSLFNLSMKYEPKDPEKETFYANPLLQKKKKEESRSRRGSEEDIHFQEESNDDYSSSSFSSPSSSKKDEKLSENSFLDLDTVLGSSTALEVFEKYLDTVAARHLLDFLKEVAIYKQVEEPALVQERAQLIFKLYLEQKKLAADEDLIQQVQESINHRIFTPDLFNYISATVFLQLNALFPDFKVYVKNEIKV